MKKVIIIGGGFAGVMAALKLLKNNFTVTLINPKANFEFCPLLPDALIKNNPSFAEFSYAPLLAYKNFQLLTEKVVALDTDAKIARGEITAVPYDYLLIATGINGKASIAGSENSILFKSVNDVEKIISHLQSTIKSGKPIALNIIGAGATGVETALSLAAYFKNHKIKNRQINLFHNQPMPLGNNPPWLATALVKILKKQSINFLPNQTITRLCPEGVVCDITLHEGELNILTAGGLANADFAPLEILDGRGFIWVDEFLQTKITNIFAAGDVCSSRNPKTAQAAEYEGKLAADNIIALENSRPLRPDNFKTRGFLIMTNQNTAVGTAFGMRINGRLAGLLRHGAYLMSLPGIKNRLRLLKAFWQNY